MYVRKNSRFKKYVGSQSYLVKYDYVSIDEIREDALYKRADTTTISAGCKSYESVMSYKEERRHDNRYSRATVI